MPVFSIKVTQLLKVHRSIVVSVEAATLEAALEAQANEDAPDNDAGWSEDHSTLENEDVSHAGDPQPEPTLDPDPDGQPGFKLQTCPKCGMRAAAFICNRRGCPVNGGAAYG